MSDLIVQIVIGVGLIGGVWKLNREVASLAVCVKIYMAKTDGLEPRLRHVEQRLERDPK